MSNVFAPIVMPISSEDQARERFRLAKMALLAARVAYANHPTEENDLALAMAQRELSTSSVFTHD